jgi:Fe-Mn family superoxide dismutase
MLPDSPDCSLTRRDAIKILGAGAAMLGVGALRSKAADPSSALKPEENRVGGPANPGVAGSTLQPFVLPPLGYGFDALEPEIDARTMEIHYKKHHQAYITNANKALADHPDLSALTGEAMLARLDAVPEPIRPAVRNNVGGHVNHSFFWKIISPRQLNHPLELQDLRLAIDRSFGSQDAFQEKFTAAALKQFGSGWAWLSLKDGKLLVHGTPNQDSPFSEGATPLIGLDVWEHAYYLKHQNLRAEYVASFWRVLNWQQAERNYVTARAT